MVRPSPRADAGLDVSVWRSQVGIPVRNLWALLVYASGLASFLDRLDIEVSEDAELVDVLARLLTAVVERRLRRNLSQTYRPTTAVLQRVRGRIDWLPTLTEHRLERGEIICRFEELTHDSARNRLVRAALEAMVDRVHDADLRLASRNLARALSRLGVSPLRPSRAELSRDRIARHDADDRLMVTIAELALDLVLPSEETGATALSRLDHDERLLRRIFESAVAGFYRHELRNDPHWRVRAQAPLRWPVSEVSEGVSALLPGMVADLVIDGPAGRMIIDTKFANILTRRQFGGESFKSGHLYQLYAYLRSQSGRGDPLADCAVVCCCTQRSTVRWTSGSTSKGIGCGSLPLI